MINVGFNCNLDKLLTSLKGQGVGDDDLTKVKTIFDECDGLDGQEDGEISTSSAWKAFRMKGIEVLAKIGSNVGIAFGEQVSQMSQEEMQADRALLAKRIETTFTDARDKLVKQLETQGVYEDPITGEKCAAKNLIKYLKNLTFKFDERGAYGAAQAMTKEGGIEVNTSPLGQGNLPMTNIEWEYSEPEIMKILLHEAFHNEYSARGANPGFNTQAEELFCERNAIRLTAQLTSDAGDNVYGTSFNTLAADPELLESTLQRNFIANGYQNRPKDASGAVNIEGKDIPKDSKVYIDNNLVGCIGPSDGLILDEIDSNHINASGEAFGNYNKVVLQEQKGAKSLEIRDNSGKVLFQAYLIPDPENNKKPSIGV